MAEEQPAEKPASSVTLPLTFATAFWTENYRSGFEALYRKLVAGIVESDEIVSHVERRAAAERELGTSIRPLALRQEGFALDEGASLKMGFEALLKQAVRESRLRLSCAEDLERNIVKPFKDWSLAHQGRIRSSQGLIESELEAYEKKSVEVAKLKAQYDELCRLADSAEDELAFDKGPATPGKVVTEDEKSVGEGDSDSDDDNDAPLFKSIGATLGRAFSTRRKLSTGPGSPSKELPETPHNGDPAMGTALGDWSKSTFSTLFEKVAGPQTGEGRSERARRDAEAVEEKYKNAVEGLDSLRLALEETLSEHFHYANACETDRLKAASSVLRSFNSSLASLSASLAPGPNDKETQILDLVRPERDVLAIIERLRTGPFRPRPTMFVSHYSEPPLQNFGIDLRKFEETLGKDDSRMPPVLSFLLDYVTEKYETLTDAEKRKLWLYETPLAAQHHLRFAINVPGQFHKKSLEKYDLPVVVSTAKLWLLELDVPPILYSHYDEYRSLYPARVGTEVIVVPAKALASHVARLPPVHLEVLRSIIQHWSELITSTTTEETNEVYLQKLSLSVSRCIIRPNHDTPLTLDDRFPTLLVADLVSRCAEIFESVDLLKTKQSEDRYKPRRQRTKPFDVRLTRRTMGIDSSSTFNSAEAEAVIRNHRNATSPTSPPPTGRSSSDTSTIIAPQTPPLPDVPAGSASEVATPALVATTLSPTSSIGSGSSLSRRVRGPRGPRPSSISASPGKAGVNELGVQILAPAEVAAPVVTQAVAEEGKEEGFSVDEARRFAGGEVDLKGKGKEVVADGAGQ